jgi:hypothetical protein
MVKRRGSSPFFEPLHCAPRRRVIRNSDEGTVDKRGAFESFSSEDIRNAVLDLVGCCTAGVWLRILPHDEDKDSLCFHTGQEWADVQPCLQELGLVTTPNHLGGKLSAPINVWEQFAGASAGLLEVGTARPRKAGTTGQRATSVFVMRKPKTREERKFASPIDQLKARFEVLSITPKPVEHQLYFRR